LTVAALTRRIGVRPGTIRYYVRIGLLSAATRTAAYHRRYDWAAVDRLRLSRACNGWGLRLSDIGDLLILLETGTCPCEPAAGVLRRRLDLDTEIAKRTELRDELAGLVAGIAAEDCPEPVPGIWRARREVPA
jgi:MerR family mercuric resistance operon transcriptional regulator